MPKSDRSPADQIKADEAALAQRRIDHEAPLFERAAELLAQIQPLTDELAALGGQFLRPYYGVLLGAPSEQIATAAGMLDHDRPRPVSFATDPANPVTDAKVVSQPTEKA